VLRLHPPVSATEAIELAGLLPDSANELAAGLDQQIYSLAKRLARKLDAEVDDIWCLAQEGLHFAILAITPQEHGNQIFEFVRLRVTDYVKRELMEGEGGRQCPRHRPHKERDQLISQWEQEGRSPQWIDAELQSRGLRPPKRPVREIAEGAAKPNEGGSEIEHLPETTSPLEIGGLSREYQKDDLPSDPQRLAAIADRLAALFDGRDAVLVHHLILVAAKHVRPNGTLNYTGVARELGLAGKNAGREVKRWVNEIKTRHESAPETRLAKFFGLNLKIA
jgi:hypothetical protein